MCAGVRHASVLLTLVVLCLSAWPAHAQQAPSRVAVVALDESDSTAHAVRRLASLLGAAGHDVQYGQQLAESLQQRQIPEPSTEDGHAFVGVSETIADGIRSYFYSGPEDAIPTLEPVVELATARFETLTFRSDLVDQVYEAGLVLLRAYIDTGQNEQAEALVGLLVRYFPAKRPSLDTVPPQIIEAVEKGRKRLAAENARISVAPVGDAAKQCTARLNGAPANEGVLVVASRAPYYLALDCGIHRTPMWRLELEPGQTVTVPLALAQPPHIRMNDDSYSERRKAENQLEMIAFWGGFEDVVGIRRPAVAPEAGEAPTLFVHMRDRRFTWTEASDRSAVDGYASRTFDVSPDAQVDLASEASSGGSSVDWLGWTSLGLGTLTAVGGGLMLHQALGDYRELRCFDNIESPSRGCDGVATVGQTIEESERVRRLRSVRTRTFLSYGVFGLATAGLGFGAYRLLFDNDTAVAVGLSGRGVLVVVNY